MHFPCRPWTARAFAALVPGCLAAALALLPPAPAAAYDFEISSRTQGHGYQLRRYQRGGVVFLNRRRVTQYLGLRVFNLLDRGQDPFAPGGDDPPALLNLHALMRFSTDFGGYAGDGLTHTEVRDDQLDLMLGALEGRNLFGCVDFTLGRQYDAELFDFFAFDGLRVRLNLPAGLYAESHFGVQVARAHPFAPAVFETDGTTGDGTGDAWSPTFGAAVGWTPGRWLDLRAAYRGTASMAPRQQGEADSPEVWGMDEEAVFLGAEGRVPGTRTRPLVGVRFNLLTGQVDDLQALLVQPLGERHRLQAEYLRSRPHFDGDSIFNIFALEPYDEVAGRYELRLLQQALRLHARFGYRRFWRDEAGAGASPARDTADPDAYSGGAGARWLTERLQAGAGVFYLGGHGGRTVGGDVDGRWRLLRWLALDGRMSLIDHQGGGFVAAEGLNFGLQAGAALHFVEGVRLHVSLEDNISALYRSALRLMAVLDLELSP